MLRLVSLLALAASLVIPSSAQAADTWSWLAYGHDTELTNYAPSTSLTAANAQRLRLWWTAQLDGPIVASPLSARVGVDGHTRQVVYETTEAGSVYALSADTGALIWKRTFDTVTTDVCGTYGFSSTGAIDLKRQLLYEIGGDGLLHALDLATGEESAPWPLRIVDRTAVEYVWGGLQLIGGRLYVPVASECDEPDESGYAAVGRLVAVDPDSAQPVAEFDTVPGYGHLGGIWGWGGVSADLDGTTLYTGVGNSYVFSDACSCLVDDAGYGDKLVALTPDLSQVLASNKPVEVPNVGDEDFGAAPLLFQPRGCPPLLAAKNKVGVLYVWDRRKIDDGPIASFGLGDGTAAFVGAPSYDPVRDLLFVSQAVRRDTGESGYGIAALGVGPECSFHQVWQTDLGNGDQPPPIVVGDVVLDARGEAGGFGALAAADGRPLWSFDTKAPTISPLIEVGGTIVGGDVDGMLYAFRGPQLSTVRPR